MDLIGKTLVVVVFGMSLMMAAVGGAALYYHIDWSDNPAASDGSAPAGELVARIAKVKQLQALVGPADLAWREARTSLLAQEERRQADQDWYYVELERLKTGDAAKQPMTVVVYEKGDAVADPNNLGRPKMEPALDVFKQPLLPLIAYNAQIADANDKTKKVLDQVAASAAEDGRLTTLLTGGDGRGLIQRLKDEQDKDEALSSEMASVQFAEGQVRADSQLLLLRKKSLEARVKELEKTAVTSGSRGCSNNVW
jgi:hypothetical protein